MKKWGKVGHDKYRVLILYRVSEILKLICFTRVAIVMNRLRQTGYQTRANGRKSCILMRWTLSVKSPLRWETRKKQHVKSSCASLSPLLLNRFFRLALWYFPSGQPVSGLHYQIYFPSSSIAKEMSGCIDWSWQPLVVIIFADDALFGNLSQHCHLPEPFGFVAG